MAAKTHQTLAIRALSIARRIIAWLALFIGFFMLAAWVGSSIPRNADWEEPKDGVKLMLETNGIHTGIIMPLVSSEKDWRELFPISDLANPNRPYTHISVSWGEREVFLHTPTWSDLTPSTTIRSAFGGDGLLHVAHYVRPMTSDNAKAFTVTREEYRALVAEIERITPPNPATRDVYPGYSTHDAFYDADGIYHIGNTCNQWTADRLAAAGIKTALWSPFPGGVMKWVPYQQ